MERPFFFGGSAVQHPSRRVGKPLGGISDRAAPADEAAAH